MAFPNKDLAVGDLLLTQIGEVYMYLGFYEGMPYSMYNVPDFGHMYLFCDSWSMFTSRFCYPESFVQHVERINKLGGVLSTQASAFVIERNLSRLRSSFDGNARYTKQPVRFESRVGHADIVDREKSLAYVYDCRRIGDRKPRGFKEPEW